MVRKETFHILVVSDRETLQNSPKMNEVEACLTKFRALLAVHFFNADLQVSSLVLSFYSFTVLWVSRLWIWFN